MIVNAIWIDGKLPLLQQICLSSWVRHGHQVKLWIYDGTDVPEGVVTMPASWILKGPIHRYKDRKHAGSPVLHANLFRYAFLAAEGGCFIDCDTLCLQYFDFSHRWTFSSEGASDHPNLAFVNIPADERRSFADDCFSTAMKRLDNPAWGKFGPKLLAEKIDVFGLNRHVLKSRDFCPLNWSEADRIFDAEPPNLNGSFGIHLWQQIFTSKGVDLSREFPESCLWEEWKREYAI